MKKLTLVIAAITLMSCSKKQEQTFEVSAQYENGINTMRRLFINQQQVPANSVNFVQQGAVINIRNANHMGGEVGAAILINGVPVIAQSCECEINLNHMVQ